MGKLSLYWHTVRDMKPSQVYHRLRKLAGLPCSLGCRTEPRWEREGFPTFFYAEDLDSDPVFLARFPVEELLQDHVTFLYEGEQVSWDGSWDFPDRSPLWNFNLHYFEYLLPLAREYRCSGNSACLEKVKEMVLGWIAANPREKGGNAWSAYTISLRLTNWLAAFGCLTEALAEDPAFLKQVLLSIRRQYEYLSQHLEKDLLGNHYFEDLKALVLCALLFEDEQVLDRALKGLLEQCREQILPDGMHFELSPMYHKIILEDVLRTAAALRNAGRPSAELEAYISPMVDAAWSMEGGLERLPLFNDCGSNVSKSLTALCSAAEHMFGIRPVKKNQLPYAGYYIFEQGDLRLIVDAGKPGPEYLPGHAHCDCMSFELFKAGKPVLVNCGTYAYQCRERLWFKSTEAHNTVMAEGTEQSRCWGAFRMAERSSVKLLALQENGIKMQMTDCAGHTVLRTVRLEDGVLTVQDEAPGKTLSSYLHMEEALLKAAPVSSDGAPERKTVNYADRFGRYRPVVQLKFEGVGSVSYRVDLKRVI